MVTRRWKLDVEPGWSFSYDWSRDGKTRIIKLSNTILTITRDTAEECQDELDAQLSDGLFENMPYFNVEEIDA